MAVSFPPPWECRAELPSMPVDIRLNGTIRGDSVSFTATFADGKELPFCCHANTPRDYGFFSVVLEDGSFVDCTERRVVASLADFLEPFFADEYTPIPAGTLVPVLDEDEAERVWKGLSIPQGGRRHLDRLNAAPPCPYQLWL